MDNGLVILTKESQPAGLVAVDIEIRAGSSLEGEYLGSGISHLIEHMLFKGTNTRRSGDIERQIRALGGLINASTSLDSTGLRAAVPAENLPKTLAILKDMLANSVFDQKEFEREREVVLKEIKLHHDQPENRIIQELYETAYITHPYRYPIIGFEERFLRLKRDDLVKYYNRMYVPNRMVISVVGGLDPKSAAGAVEKEFGDFKPSDYQQVAVSAEPPQVGKRAIESETDINLAYLAMGFHSTSVFDSDMFAMDVLSMILGRGDNSRLVETLIKRERLAYSVSAWNYTPRDPGLFVINAVADKKNIAAVEAGIMDEIRNIKNGQIRDDELEAAKRMVLSDYIFSRQTVEEQAQDISGNELLTGNHDFSRIYVSGIQAVTKEDIKRLAGAYLTEGNLTAARLVGPDRAAGGGQKATGQRPGTGDSIQKYTLPNSLRILLRENRKTPTVGITVAMLGGIAAESASDNGISNLTSRMLLKGTSGRKEDMIKGAIDAMGGNISSYSGLNSFGINISILKSDIDTTLAILRDILTDSIFPQDELDKEKELVIAGIKDDEDDIFTRGSNALRKDLYPDSPYGMRYTGKMDTVMALGREDLLGFYRKYCVPNNMVISVSGDIDKETLLKKLTELFKNMRPKEVPAAAKPPAGPRKATAESIRMERDQSLLLEGFVACGIKESDRYSVETMCAILSGMSGRLFSELRDKMSLAYTLGCVPRFGLETGYIIFYIATTKDKLTESRKALLAQISDMRGGRVNDEELEHAKRELLTGFDIEMQANNFVTSQSAIDELYGLGPDNLYRYKEMIAKVSGNDINAAAKRYLDPNARAEIEISPK